MRSSDLSPVPHVILLAILLLPAPPPPRHGHYPTPCRFLHEQAGRNKELFNTFYAEFGHFLKEGVCTDVAHKDEIAKLLRFESSKAGAGKLVSLDEYISRMPPEHKKIYYLTAPSRDFVRLTLQNLGFY